MNARLAQLAAGQHGVVTARQLEALGLTRTAVARRTASGSLHRLGRGIYAVGHERLSPVGRRHAALLAAGPGAVLSHVTAARLWKVLPESAEHLDKDRVDEELIHVTVDRRVDSRGWIKVHCVRHFDRRDRVLRDDLPVTTLTRTLLDLAATEEPGVLRRAVREAQVRHRLSEYALRVQLDRARGRHGARHLAGLIADGPTPTRSVLEDRVLELMLAGGLRKPAINVRVAVAERRSFEVDFLFARERVIVEADGARYHDNRLARQADVDRQALLEAAGYNVIRLNWRQVTRDAEQTARRLHVALSNTQPDGTAR